MQKLFQNSSITFKSQFRGCKNSNDPKVTEKLCRQAMAILQAALKGEEVERNRLLTAQFIVDKFVAKGKPQNVQVNFIQWNEVMKSVEKAGLSLPALNLKTEKKS